MPSSRYKHTAIIVLAVTLLSIVIGYGAAATTARFRPPTVVVTVNIGQVLSDLTEKADAEAKLQTLITKIENELNARQGKVDEMRESYDDAEDADKEEIGDMLEQLMLEGVSYQRFAEAQIDNEKSLMLRDLYIKIKNAIVSISEENGYDIVLISDVEREIRFAQNSQVSREAQVLEQIGFQRAVYTSSQIDITEQVVTHMNLEWEKHSNR
ncbi:MAG: OmpH family outer membrane protein [Phycisphaerales bacterium]|nr:OmpH family outer membrane protein [Phycisphaerales bacterium]